MTRIRRYLCVSPRTACPAPRGAQGTGPRGAYGPYTVGYGPSVLAGRGDDVVHGRPGALAADLAMGGEQLAHR